MTTTPKYEVRYASGAEAARFIRAALKKAFPATKFSVRTSTYSGGSSVDIRWTDGPTQKAVDAIVNVFEGKGFDGMIDMQYSINAWVLNGQIIGTRCPGTLGSRGTVSPWGMIPPHDDAEQVHFGCWVHTHRQISPALANRCIAQIATYWGGVTEIPVAVPGYFGHQLEPAEISDKPARPDLGGNGSWVHYCWSSMIRRAAENRMEFVRQLQELHDVDRRN